MKLVVDANVAIDWYVPSAPGQAYSMPLAVLAADTLMQLYVPLPFDLEVAAVLLHYRRTKPTTFDKKWLDLWMADLDLTDFQIIGQGVNFKLLSDLSQAYKLKVYDTPYFHLAREMGLPIAIRDDQIIKACAQWNVEHWQPINTA